MGERLFLFDGYMSGPSTKVNAHLRRMKGESKQINFTSEMKFHGTKSSFLANVHNKSKIIQLIGLNLRNAGCTVVYAEEDADVDIAILACRESLSKNITVVGEDSDILVLLLYYSTIFDSAFKLMYRSDIWKCKYENGHNIFHYRDLLGKESCVQLLFIYAFTGCDTTSALFSIGKQTVFNFFLSNNEFQNVSKVFTRDCMGHNEIEQAGLINALLLYRAKLGEIMATLRSRILNEKVLNSTTFVNPERLPPTKDSLKYHSYRCYFQILKCN